MLPGAERVEVADDDERALVRVVAELEAGSGFRVAVLRTTASVVHVEVLDDGADLPWTPGSAAGAEGVGGSAPWNRLGWLRATRPTIEATVGAQVETVRQVKHWSISAIVEATTAGGGAYWWKQVPAFMAHEGRLVRWLGERRPGLVPEVVAVGDDWSLCRPFPLAAAPSDAPSEASPYADLAELQRDLATSVDELLALGCPDRRLDVVVRDVVALGGRDDLVVDAALRRRLQEATGALEDRAATLAAGPVSVATLVHGDLHRGNWIRRADGGWCVFDWTDGCVSHPFLDLGVLPSEEGPVRSARLDAYLGPWRAAVGDAAVADAVAAALPLGVAFQAASYQRIVDAVGDGEAGGDESWGPVVGRYVERLLDLLAAGATT